MRKIGADEMENCYQVRKIDLKNVEGRRIQVRVPGSKSITNRALLLAMLSDGACLLNGALFSDDSRYLQQCIADLGFALRAEEEKETIWIIALICRKMTPWPVTRP